MRCERAQRMRDPLGHAAPACTLKDLVAMPPLTSGPVTPKVTDAIGKLRVGGDWACAHGDFAGLRHVAKQLAAYTPEALHCTLLKIVATCDADPAQAAELWSRLKGLICDARKSD